MIEMVGKVVYLPSINKSPAEMATVNGVIHLIKAKADALQLTEVDLVLDHAIYCKALEIIRNPVSGSLKNVINHRMEGFHAECIFISVLSKRFLDCSLKDLLIEARLVEDGSTISALFSPHYTKAMRIQRYVYEAFMRCKIQSFEELLVEVNDVSSPITPFKESKLLSELIRNPNNETLPSCLEELEKEVFESYERFENEIQNDFCPTASYWNSYLDMV